jgi:hypothetical protein
VEKPPPEVHIPTANVVVALLNWGGDLDHKVENALWRLSTHPSIVAFMKVELSSAHRGKNAILQQLIESVEYQESLQETQGKSAKIFSHVLMISQDCIVDDNVVDRLIAANQDFISAVSLTREFPFYPAFIPAASAMDLRKEKPALDHYQELLQKPNAFEAELVETSVILMKLTAVKRIARPFSEYHEWFWLGDDWFSINCFKPFSSSQQLTLHQKTNYERFVVEMRPKFMDEDNCFSALLHRYGFKLYVDPQAKILQHKSVYMSTDIIQKKQLPILEELSVSRSGKPTVVENRRKLELEGKNFVYNRPTPRASIVVATTIWSDFVREFFCLKFIQTTKHVLILLL